MLDPGDERAPAVPVAVSGGKGARPAPNLMIGSAEGNDPRAPRVSTRELDGRLHSIGPHVVGTHHIVLGLHASALEIRLGRISQLGFSPTTPQRRRMDPQIEGDAVEEAFVIEAEL